MFVPGIVFSLKWAPSFPFENPLQPVIGLTAAPPHCADLLLSLQVIHFTKNFTRQSGQIGQIEAGAVIGKEEKQNNICSLNAIYS